MPFQNVLKKYLVTFQYKQNIYEKSVEKETEEIEPVKETPKEKNNINLENKKIGSPKNKKEITVDYIMKKYLNKTDEDLPMKKRNKSEEFTIDKRNPRRNTLYNSFLPKFDIKSIMDKPKDNIKIQLNEIPQEKNKVKDIIEGNTISEISELKNSEEEISKKEEEDDLYEDKPHAKENITDKRQITVDYIKKKYLNKTDEDIPIKSKSKDFKYDIKEKKNRIFDVKSNIQYDFYYR